MCGILGGNRPEWDYAGAIQKLKHRGPNKQQVKRIKNMFMGFARLSIIDLSESAMQPMLSADGRYALIFNGEIYDYRKLRNELELKGYVFLTDSDTEVLLHAFEEWREKAVDHLDGIFAFAVLDTQLDELYLFRDRCGIKPVYYYQRGSDFAFSSELKGITSLCRNTEFEPDNTALYDYHTYLYIPAPKTMYKNVYKLPPAHYLVYDVKKKRIREITRYWKVKLNTREGNSLSDKRIREKADELRYHLDRAVQRQLIADVPVGTFLSGGVDSSIITSIAHSHKEDITAYTIGFYDRRYDESPYAKKVADIIGVACKDKYFDRDEYKNMHRLMQLLYDEPFADTSAYPTLFLSEFAKKDVTVALTGDGGDELFGGYNRCLYLRDALGRKRSNSRKISNAALRVMDSFPKVKTVFQDRLMEDVAVISSTYQYSIKPDRKKVREKYGIARDYDDFWYYRKYYHKELPVFTRMRYLDFMTYLNGDILTKVDRASMQVSLEARVPFLDREVVEFAFSLTQEECNPSGKLKGLLKYAYQNEIPRALLDRKKQGFSIPFSYLRDKRSPQEIIIESIWGI